ncbi:putative laccase-9 [Cornus florida]|uniref:putative laccase-9 n=1 Tax=Cornus florida TaxID=4283 RepID=UPI00289FE376|nr:putative laccase-9 [Cornus florida]
MHKLKKEILFWKYLILFITFLLICRCNIHYHDFILREANFTRLCSTKSMLIVNDSYPGPVIHVHRGDMAFVNVHNQGNYGVTIHWHGVKQPRNPWSDGPEYITQCPIKPGTNFTYEVIFSSEEGTLWWHAHSDWTRSSVHGAIVIYPAIGTTYPFTKPDDEEIIVIGSWYNGDINKEVLEDLQTGVDMPESDAFVINGQPGDFSECSNGTTTYRRLIDSGKTYLLRIVNAAMNADLFFAIAQHNITVVGMDGNYLKPIATPYIVISPGQTMDVLLSANQSLGQYYMATREYHSADYSDYDATNATAILEYRGNYTPPAYPSFPSYNLPSSDDFVAANNFLDRLRSMASPEYPVKVPEDITTRMFIVVSMNMILVANGSLEGITEYYKLASSMNNISFVNPATDVMDAYYWNMSGFYTTDFPDQPSSYFNFTESDVLLNASSTVKGTKVKILNYNEAVEIIFQGTNFLDASEAHPMHLHGYNFFVVGTGYGDFDPEIDPKGYNLVDPPQLNTFAVPKNGWLAIRFVATNPGVWYWHCHFDRHLSWGMSTVFIVKNGDTPETSVRDPPANLPQCEVPLTNWLKQFYHSDGEVYIN